MQNFMVFLFLLSFLFIHGSPKVITENYPYRYCSDATVSPNATFLSNLKLLTSALTSNASHKLLYQKSSVGQPPNPARAYGDFQCRGDLNATECRSCVATATANSSQNYCPLSVEAVLWFDECFLRYTNNGSFFSAVVKEPSLILINSEDIERDQVGGFDQVVVSTLNSTAANASSARGTLKFGTKEANFGNETLFTLAQCTGDLSKSNCGKCLRDALANFPDCCSGKKGGRVLFPSCTLRYELYRFYAVASSSIPPAPAPIAPSPAPDSNHPSPDSSPSPTSPSSPSAPPPSTAAPPLLSGKGRATVATVIGIIASCLL